MFTPDELKLLSSRIKYDIKRLKNFPQQSDRTNGMIRSAIQRREKILHKLESLRKDSPYANS